MKKNLEKFIGHSISDPPVNNTKNYQPSPSKVWAESLQERKAKAEQIKRESLQYTCCEVRLSIRRRNNSVVCDLGNF